MFAQTYYGPAQEEYAHAPAPTQPNPLDERPIHVESVQARERSHSLSVSLINVHNGYRIREMFYVDPLEAAQYAETLLDHLSQLASVPSDETGSPSVALLLKGVNLFALIWWVGNTQDPTDSFDSSCIMSASSASTIETRTPPLRPPNQLPLFKISCRPLAWLEKPTFNIVKASIVYSRRVILDWIMNFATLGSVQFAHVPSPEVYESSDASLTILNQYTYQTRRRELDDAQFEEVCYGTAMSNDPFVSGWVR